MTNCADQQLYINSGVLSIRQGDAASGAGTLAADTIVDTIADTGSGADIQLVWQSGSTTGYVFSVLEDTSPYTSVWSSNVDGMSATSPLLTFIDPDFTVLGATREDLYVHIQGQQKLSIARPCYLPR